MIRYLYLGHIRNYFNSIEKKKENLNKKKQAKEEQEFVQRRCVNGQEADDRVGRPFFTRTSQ